MSDEDVLKYLAGQSSAAKPVVKTRARPVTARPRAAKPRDTFENFSATHLFCPKCRQAMPVREKLLLYLPTGDLYDYCCERCGTSVGTRKAGN